MTSSAAGRRDLAAAVRRQAQRTGERTPSVRGGDWRLATVTAVNSDGTVDVDDIDDVRCMESYLHPAVGDVIRIDQSSSGNWLAMGRTATTFDPVGGFRAALRETDLPRTTTTPSADPVLTLTVTPGAVYILDGAIKYSGPGDLEIGWSYPVGTGGEWNAHGLGTTVVSSTSGGALQQDATSAFGYMMRAESSELSTPRVYGGVGTTDFVVFLAGVVRPTASGSFALSWAQGTANATATTVYANSWLRLHRIR